MNKRIIYIIAIPLFAGLVILGVTMVYKSFVSEDLQQSTVTELINPYDEDGSGTNGLKSLNGNSDSSEPSDLIEELNELESTDIDEDFSEIQQDASTL